MYIITHDLTLYASTPPSTHPPQHHTTTTPPPHTKFQVRRVSRNTNKINTLMCYCLFWFVVSDDDAGGFLRIIIIISTPPRGRPKQQPQPTPDHHIDTNNPHHVCVYGGGPQEW